MIPAMRNALDDCRLQYLTPNYEILVLKSQTEMVELGPNVGYAPYSYYLPAESIQKIWDNVVTITRQSSLEEFKHVFLVAVGHLSPTDTVSHTFDEAMAKTVELWERGLDMQHVPEGDMEIRIESQMAV